MACEPLQFNKSKLVKFHIETEGLGWGTTLGAKLASLKLKMTENGFDERNTLLLLQICQYLKMKSANTRNSEHFIDFVFCGKLEGGNCSKRKKLRLDG